MKGWQRNILFVIVASVVAFVMYSAAKFFGFINNKEEPK